jgi:hypothetical protein
MSEENEKLRESERSKETIRASGYALFLHR